MRIAICGLGVVGNAVANVLHPHHQLVHVDPKIGPLTVKDASQIDAVIVCVPTPQAADGKCDSSFVMQVLGTVEEKVPVLVKSTVSLQAWDQLSANFRRHSLTFSPEFLTQNNAVEDFATSREMYFGGTPEATQFWVNDVFAVAFPNCTFVHMTVAEAVLIKYFRNSYLASKVVWFNEAKDISDSVGCNWDIVRRGVASDGRIGDSHTHVTAARGYGGACFPKDVTALLAEHRHSLVEAAHKWNQAHRGME